MPFFKEKQSAAIERHHHTRTIVNKETIIEKVPVNVLNASMDNLTVTNLNVTHLTVPDISVFYPPPIEPNMLNTAFIDFSTNENEITLRLNNQSFFSFYPDTSVLKLPDINAPIGTFQTVRTARIETTEGNDIGGVLLNKGTVNAPSNAFVGEKLVARYGAVGGVTLKDGNGVFSNVLSKTLTTQTLSTDIAYINTLSCATPVSFSAITTQSLRVLGDSCISGVKIHDCGIFCDFGNISILRSGRLELDNISMISEDDCMSITSGIFTPSSSTNDIGCIHTEKSVVSVSGTLCAPNATIKTLTAETINISDMVLQTANICRLSSETANFGQVICSNIVTENTLTAKDFRLLDGTSILNNLLPKGIITLFVGSVPPRGWLKCDGRGGTPLLTGPSPDVIYIVRV